MERYSNFTVAALSDEEIEQLKEKAGVTEVLEIEEIGDYTIALTEGPDWTGKGIPYQILVKRSDTEGSFLNSMGRSGPPASTEGLFSLLPTLVSWLREYGSIVVGSHDEELADIWAKVLPRVAGRTSQFSAEVVYAMGYPFVILSLPESQ